MSLNEYIKKNKEFWQGNIQENCYKKLLIEEIDLPCILHDLAIHSTLLNKAKDYQPIWLSNENVSLELLQSYVPCAEKAQKCKLNFMELAMAFASSIYQFTKILVNRNILSVKYDGVKYGDIIYDVYLSRKQVGTIKNIDHLVFKLILNCIKRHIFVTKILKINNISGVLVSHRIGITSGVLLRASLRAGREVFSLAGMHRATLYKSASIEEIIEYEYKPNPKDIESLLSLPQEKFDRLYNFVNDFHLNGNSSMDSKFAFSNEYNFYKERQSFAKDFSLDPTKKNIFIMLHAFTDFPHSHFKWMIFNDYADWFLKTLEYSKKDKSVNWIFKQHPSTKFYPTKDINFDKLFENLPKNIIFLDIKNRLDTRSLVNISDAVITCLGSAGFEMPAMAGVPSVTAGDNHYEGFDFSLNPKTKKEYFDVLANLKNIEKLSFEDQKTAKAVYMFIYYFCSVDFTAMPILTMEDHHKPNMNDWYWNKVIETYEKNRDLILSQMNKYAKEVSKDDFKALRSSIEELERGGVLCNY